MYDANGNLTAKNGTAPFISTVTLTYDALNRLTSGIDSGVGTENYTYNALDRLASIVVPAPVPGEPGTQGFFYDERGNIINIYDAAGNVLTTNFHNDRNSRRSIDNYLLSFIQGLFPGFFGQDGWGNLTLLVRGNQIFQQLFDHFGSRQVVGGIPNNILGAGENVKRDRINATYSSEKPSGGGQPGQVSRYGVSPVRDNFGNANWFQLSPDIIDPSGQLGQVSRYGVSPVRDNFGNANWFQLFSNIIDPNNTDPVGYNDFSYIIDTSPPGSPSAGGRERGGLSGSGLNSIGAVSEFGDPGQPGAFFFFSPDNLEVILKALDGCGFNQHFWVFFAATTNVEFTLTVTDTETNQIREYGGPLGVAFQPITDTSAFATCP